MPKDWATKGTSTRCDTCKAISLFSYPVIYPDTKKTYTIMQYDTTVYMRIADYDSNGQRTGWLDKRYVKMTSDSTFVILPKTITK